MMGRLVGWVGVVLFLIPLYLTLSLACFVDSTVAVPRYYYHTLPPSRYIAHW